MDVFALWMPILVAAVVVFIASFLAWMVLPHHKADIKPLPDEQALAEQLARLELAPGLYMWPNCAAGEDMKSAEFKQRYERGPWGSLNVLPAKPNFARNLLLTFIVYLVISIFVGYLGSLACPAGSEFARVFRVTGAAAILGYCMGALPGALFLGKPTRFILTDLVDGVAYGLLTGLVFALLWPAAPALLNGIG